MLNITEDDNIVDILLKNKKDKNLSLLYFTAKWCGPCKKISPLIEKLSIYLNENGYNIKLYKIDIDNNEEFCNKCEIKSVPTFFIMNHKVLLSSITGSNIDKVI